MNVLSQISTLFETYRGHDQTLGLIGYGLTMTSGAIVKRNATLANKLSSLSSQISNSRVILRLLDDPSMLGYTLSYGLGKQEKNLLVRVLNVTNNLASHLYYICEHIAWLADNKILNLDSGIYWLISTLSWLISLLASITCNIIALKNMFYQLNRDVSTSKDKSLFKKEMFSKKFLATYFKLFEDIFFIINAIHWLPPGFLWSGKLSNFKSGLLGVLAVLCNLIVKIYF